jgi:tetratricopeptide (TPR) repeat protein
MTTIDDLWDENDLARTETLLKVKATEVSMEEPLYWLIQTQIARTHSARGSYARAHKLLDQVEPRITADRTLRARYLLERGRTYKGEGQPTHAEGYFLRAWELARVDEALAYHAVDAATMLAQLADPDEAASWYITAIGHARRSSDERTIAQQASLSNTLAWVYHDQGNFERALTFFEEAVPLRRTLGDPDTLRMARWCVGRCLRSMGRYEEALAIQRELLATMPEGERRRGGLHDGFIEEEMAELLYLMGRPEEARPYYAAAYEKLSQYVWLAKGDPARLARLKRKANPENSS